MALTKEKFDLLSAKVEAAGASRTEKKTIYIMVDDDGDCTLHTTDFLPKHETIAAYRNGSEVPLDDEVVTPEPTKNKKMAETKTPAKPAAKKPAAPAKKSAPAKKVAAKKVVKPAAKAAKKAEKPKAEKLKEPTVALPKGAKVQELKMKEIVALMLKGTAITSLHGIRLSIKAIRNRQNQDKLRKVIVLPAE